MLIVCFEDAKRAESTGIRRGVPVRIRGQEFNAKASVSSMVSNLGISNTVKPRWRDQFLTPLFDRFEVIAKSREQYKQFDWPGALLMSS